MQSLIKVITSDLKFQKTNSTIDKLLSSKVSSVLLSNSNDVPSAEDFQSQVTAKLENRLQVLQKLRSSLNEATVTVSKLYIASKQDKLLKLEASLKILKQISASKPPPGIKVHLRSALNELISLREGIHIGDTLSSKDLSIVSCVNAVKHTDELITKTKEKLQGKEQVKDNLLFTQDIEKVIKNSIEESKNLQSLKDKEFVISRIPLIPVAKGYLSIEGLKRVGLNAESLGGYPVLHNQLVIGINPKFLDHGKKKNLPKQALLDAANSVRKLIQKQTKTKLQFVDERACGASGGAWFWIMPEKELDLLASVFPGKSVRLTNWGFAR